MGGRLFNEKEVSEILRRASLSRSGQDSGSDGVSLQELQQIGAELGYDPADIELAAKQLGSKVPLSKGFFSPRVILDQTVDGVATDDDWKGMVAAIQRYHKGAGAVTQRGSNYDWTGSEEGASLALTVNVRNGRTRIRLESNRWMGLLMSSVFCPVFGTMFSLILAKHFGPLGALPVIAAFGTLYFGFLRWFGENHRQGVSGLMDRLIDEVGTGQVHPLVGSVPVETETTERSVQA